MYTEKDLVRIARRKNNKKRNYLVVNQLQGKHIPVQGKTAFQMFDELANLLKKEYLNEKLLLIGFAETATAIGARVAVQLNSLYIQTTREQIPEVEYLYFSEEHSHATEQKLVKNDIDSCIEKIDRIIFVEDEVTTGNTILNIIRIIRKMYDKKVPFSVASILNGMEESALNIYEEQGIPLHYLVKTQHDKYAMMADRYQKEGTYHVLKNAEEHSDLANEEIFGNRNLVSQSSTSDASQEYEELLLKGYLNARRLVDAGEYEKACEHLWAQLMEQEKNHFSDKNILVLGTEEFMYPAIYIAARFDEQGVNAVSHATTRSPISVFDEEEYPLHVSNEIQSLYDGSRTTYVYDVGKYNKVYIITDSKEKGLEKDLLTVIKNAGNDNITLVRWGN